MKDMSRADDFVNKRLKVKGRSEGLLLAYCISVVDQLSAGIFDRDTS